MTCQCMGLSCGECRKTIPFPTNQPTQSRLRGLRLWHWGKYLQATGQAQRAAVGRLAETYRQEANTHMQAVQTLNDFFALGDTAARDHQRIDVA